MNRDEIIRMAREAGISKPWDQEPVPWKLLTGFATLVAADQRKSILQLIDELIGSEDSRNPMFGEGYNLALFHMQEFLREKE